MNHLLRQYDPALDSFDNDGYPLAWREIKHMVRADAGNRCVRCKHPYRVGANPLQTELDEFGNEVLVSWSSCDEECNHGGPVRLRGVTPEWLRGWEFQVNLVVDDDYNEGAAFRTVYVDEAPVGVVRAMTLKHEHVDARWRVLTVHHLDGDKANCRWWNLVPLCQRCHLSVQLRVVMDRPYDRPHTTWMQPYVAGFYAWKYLAEDLSRSDVERRLEELLLLELRQERLFAV